VKDLLESELTEQRSVSRELKNKDGFKIKQELLLILNKKTEIRYVYLHFDTFISYIS